MNNVRFYDNGGATADRYTAVYLRRVDGVYHYASMNGSPFHPQGICQHGETAAPCDALLSPPVRVGRRHPALGVRVRFDDLPEDARKAVLQDLRELQGGAR